MKRAFGWGFAAAIVCFAVGCAPGSPAPATTAPATASTATPDTDAFPEPDFMQQSRLFVVSDNGNVVKVGDSDEAFKAAYRRSATKSRSLDGDLPVGATNDHWTARGWALDDASRGVGALFYDDHIALVMSQFDNVDEDTVTAEVSKYEMKFGPPNRLEGKHVRYWFWPGDPATLMICAFKAANNEINLTTALGDSSVMGRLHMSYPAAQQDMDSVERLYSPLAGSEAASGQTQ